MDNIYSLGILAHITEKYMHLIILSNTEIIELFIFFFFLGDNHTVSMSISIH